MEGLVVNKIGTERKKKCSGFSISAIFWINEFETKIQILNEQAQISGLIFEGFVLFGLVTKPNKFWPIRS